MKNLKVRIKLYISYFVVVLLLITSVVYSIFEMNSISKEVNDFYEGPFKVVASANTINERFAATQKYIYQAIAEDNERFRNEAIQNFRDANNAVNEHFAVIEERFSGDPKLVSQLKKLFAELTPMREQVLQYVQSGDSVGALAYLRANNTTKINQIQIVIDAILDDSNSTAEEMVLNLKDSQRHSIIIVGTLCIFSIVAVILFAAYVTNSITKPILEVEQAAMNIAEGKLDTAINYQSSDEIGHLAESMRKTIDNLSIIISDINHLTEEIAEGNLCVSSNNADIYVGAFKPIYDSIQKMISILSSTMTQIKESADQVAAGSNQVANGAQALSQGATEQASSIEELSAAINEITDQVKHNASNAQNARTQSELTLKEVEASNQQMKELIQAIDEINDKSNEISKIIKTIDEIAFQTNILALNAAVEAARAGSAGKGFAVVADEVRNLAGKSAEAAKNTTTLIEDTINAVEKGTKIADQTAEAMVRVVNNTEKVSAYVNEIAQASEEQSTSLIQVTSGLDQISAVVQTNSATAEESAAASEELSSQAQVLNKLVSTFKISDTLSTVISDQEDNNPEDLTEFDLNETDDIDTTDKY